MRFPSDEEFNVCVADAEAWVTAFEAARTTRSHDLAFGLDVSASSLRAGPAQIAQFIVAASATAPARLVAAKRMPAPGREGAFVYLWPEDHHLPVLTPLDGLGVTLPTVCHESTAFNHRAVATTTEPWRVDRRAVIQADIRRPDVSCLFNAIHRLWRGGDVTFYTSYNAILEERPDLRIAGAFGSASDVEVAEAIRLARRLTRGFSSYVEAFPATW